MKVPPHQYEATIRFYRDVIGLKPAEASRSDVFAFGANRLWIDRVETMSQAEIWLELTTEDVDAAAEHLAKQGAVRCDQVERLPEGFRGFWITSPDAVVHLVRQSGQ